MLFVQMYKSPAVVEADHAACAEWSPNVRLTTGLQRTPCGRAAWLIRESSAARTGHAVRRTTGQE
ncbi:protein of unknown function [Bradyrhizobium vignae]|uniref:Uncharacterized protein n=1 Tax=Bradyrhizobium vignae TaxID=1549949 RepID=A0A2U3PYH3_9BRAD|nr:protein of unknown function [Bradyrhizobium vignae]